MGRCKRCDERRALRIDYSKTSPGVVTQLTSDGVHIEQLSDQAYYMQIEGHVFEISTVKRGRVEIVLKHSYNGG